MSDSETDEDEAFARKLQEQEDSLQKYDYEADLALARQLQEQEETQYTIDADLALARQLQQQDDCGNSSSKPIVIEESSTTVKEIASASVIKSATPDPDNELYDPTPDLHQLFLAFDQQYFNGQLASVEVSEKGK